MSDSRTELISYLTGQLIGPLGGVNEFVTEIPSKRYLSGILFPREMESSNAFEDDIIDEDGGQFGQEIEDDPVVLANQRMPSSAGISFVLSGTARFAVTVGAGVYERSEELDDVGNAIKGWRRSAITESVTIADDGTTRVPVLAGRGSVRIVRRPNAAGQLVTVALVNETTKQAGGETLHQVSMSCAPLDGWISGYPTSGVFFRDVEEEEHALIYRERPVFAIGHGASATWVNDGIRASEVSITFMPEETVPDAVFDIDGFESALVLERLSRLNDDPDGVLDSLSAFVEAYGSWSNHLRSHEVPGHLADAKQRIIDRQSTAIHRMGRGVELLRSDEEARLVFALANRAMLMQMTHSRGIYGAKRKKKGQFAFAEPNYASQTFAWRPFQLAFLLLNLESIVRSDSDDRTVVDLIWFPTGGGKTEAYLAVVAMTVLLRRWRHGDAGAGTAVITRYTLRLLTSQQFQRAAALVCALEIIRREDRKGSDRFAFGDLPISIGLWVGGGSSPNTYSDAADLRQSLLEDNDDGSVGFQVELCPWCGTEVIPARRSRTVETLGVTAGNNMFRLWCPNETCPFHEHLPLSSVDDDLYDRPPSVLIATVDKFARLVWEPRSGVFLGACDLPGPDLIIQDELHLISGPLGTIMGLYEAAFDRVMRLSGANPKIVASTATIRSAGDHVRGLFDRDVFLFPPSGLDADDSYFVRLDRDSPGRRYIGLMPQAHTPTTATVRVSAGLLQAPMEIEFDEPAADQFWTLVAYHNSLRELGKTVTLARDDIPSWISITASDESLERKLDRDEDVIELTSNIPAASIPRELEKLSRPRGSKDAVSLVACTNMISVGVDVPRLGLMLVIGQPKTTSEYIQATSRVGRTQPGLVVTLLSSAKARDRSHFESFRGYHGALYRNVEPSSVTPFALPARRRALHAALVVLVRHTMGLPESRDADAFDGSDPRVAEAIDWLTERAASVDPLERDSTSEHLDRLVADWERKTNDPMDLHYFVRAKQFPSLLRRFGQPGDAWMTLDSMRSVDVETLMKVRGEGSAR